MGIKELDREELKNALELIWSVFQEFEAPDYSEEGINRFRDIIAIDSIIARIDNNEMAFWGSYDNDALIGVIASANKNHITFLFVKKEYHRQGIGRSLWQTIIDCCKDDPGIKEITVNSTPYATEFYHRLGFMDLDRENISHGIRFTPMRYVLVKGK
jgi:GNAT superfamily N-acetyltransferase